MAVRVTKDDFEDKVINNKLPVIVDFYSDSCIVCKKLAPVLGDLEENYAGKIDVVKVNTNFDVQLSEKYNILSNPTILVFKEGREIDRKTGAVAYKDLETWIANYI